MTRNSKETKLFCSVYEIKRGTKTIQGIAISDDIEGVRQSIDKTPSPKDIETDETKSVEFDAEDELALDLGHFYTSLQKYYELAYISAEMENVFSGGYFENVILKFAKDNLPFVEEYSGNKIYHLTELEYDNFSRISNRWSDIRDGIESFSPAILVSIVASYDALFSELFKNILLLRPERYGNSDKQISVSDLLKLNSFEDVVVTVITSEVEAIISKSHVDQIIAFEKMFNISVKEKFSQWGEFAEIFERRNLAAHGELFVDQKYIDNCKRQGYVTKDVKVGDVLKVDRRYLVNVLDILIDIGTRLVFAAWHKRISDERAKAFSTVVGSIYDLIKAKRFSVARNIAEFVRTNYVKDAPDADLKAITINQAIALKKMKLEKDAISLLDDTDWGGSASVYKMCVACILQKEEEAVALLPIIKATKEITPKEFREWPAFDWMRDNPNFAKAFYKIYKQPLVKSVQLENVSNSVSGE